MRDVIVDKATTVVGQSFLELLAALDFERLESLFAPKVRFRALLPPRTCEENTAAAATGWLRRWFGAADTLEVLQSNAGQVFDRLYLRYRLRSHDATNGWRVIEQQAYCDLNEGHIVDMWLLCSGFRPDAENRDQIP